MENQQRKITISPGHQAAWAITALGFAIRLLPFHFVFKGGSLVPFGVDACYHMRRANLLIEDFPAWRLYDYFINYPRGAPIYWPPGFDFLLALPGLLGLGQSAMQLWAALVPPLFGALAIYLTYRLGRKVFGESTGLIGAAFLALFPAHIDYTFVGNIDHHSVIAPITLALCLCLINALRDPDEKKARRFALAVAVLAGSGVALWSITPALFFLPIPAALFFSRFTAYKKRAKIVALYALLPAFLLALIEVWSFGHLGYQLFALFQPSLFLVFPYLLAAVVVNALFLKWRYQLVFYLLIAAGAGALPALFPESIQPLKYAVGIASSREASFLMTPESLPLFTGLKGWDFIYATRAYSYLIYLVPFILFAAGRRMVKQRAYNPQTLVFACYLIVAVVLQLAQTRFSEFASPALAILFGLSFVQGGRLVAAYLKSAPDKRRAGAVTLLLGLSLALGLFPLFTGLSDLYRKSAYRWPLAVIDYGKQLQRLLPPLQMENGRPDFGIIDNWESSACLLYQAGYPVMMSPFGLPESTVSNGLGYRILFSLPEDEGYRLLRENKIRYAVITNQLTPELLRGATGLAGDEREFVRFTADEFGRSGIEILPPFTDAIHTRLFFGDGAGLRLLDSELKPLQHFRLIHEAEIGNSVLGHTVAAFKTFEIVTGAKIIGEAAPGETVTLAVNVTTNIGRGFIYRRRVKANESGEFEFIVPYFNINGDGRNIGQPYRISYSDRSHEVEVGEQAVRNGLSVLVE